MLYSTIFKRLTQHNTDQRQNGAAGTEGSAESTRENQPSCAPTARCPPSSAATLTVATGAFAQTKGSGRGRGAFTSMTNVASPVTPSPRASHGVSPVLEQRSMVPCKETGCATAMKAVGQEPLLNQEPQTSVLVLRNEQPVKAGATFSLETPFLKLLQTEPMMYRGQTHTDCPNRTLGAREHSQQLPGRSHARPATSRTAGQTGPASRHLFNLAPASPAPS